MKGASFTPAMVRVHDRLIHTLEIESLFGRAVDEVNEEVFSILEEEMKKL